MANRARAAALFASVDECGHDAGTASAQRVADRDRAAVALVLAEVFNILRDWYNNRAGRDDPKAMDKFERGEKIEGQKRIAVPRRQRSIRESRREVVR